MNSKNESAATEQLQIIRGLPLNKVLKKRTVEEVLDYMPHDGDVIIASYPKTGTTWMQYIVQQILAKGENFPDCNDMWDKIIPYMEQTGIAVVDAITTKPRVYKRHLPYNMVKKNPKAKVIYVYRKPEDTFVSFFYFMSSVLDALDFEVFFESFLSGNITYGRYFEHILSFLEYKDDPNVLLVSYEKLKANTKGEILGIAKFIGQEYYDAMVSDESTLRKVLEHTSFEYMKNNLSFSMPIDPVKDGFSRDVPQKEVTLFRHGAVGEGKKSLPEDKQNQIRKLAEELLKGTDILKEWYEN